MAGYFPFTYSSAIIHKPNYSSICLGPALQGFFVKLRAYLGCSIENYCLKKISFYRNIAILRAKRSRVNKALNWLLWKNYQHTHEDKKCVIFLTINLVIWRWRNVKMVFSSDSIVKRKIFSRIIVIFRSTVRLCTC